MISNNNQDNEPNEPNKEDTKNTSNKDNVKEVSENNKDIESKEKDIPKNEIKDSNTIENKENINIKLDEKKINDNDKLELKKEANSSEFFLLKKKRLLELNKISNSFINSGPIKRKKNENSFKDNKDNENEINNEDEYEYEDNYNESYSNENIDYVEEEQINILEEMYLDAKKSVCENKINLYLDIIHSDETKEKIWSYKCYEEICLLYIEFEEHEKFIIYYNYLRKIAHLIEEKKMRTYVKYTAKHLLGN